MLNRDHAAAYLAALVDGEGHVRRFRNRSVSIANTEWDIIEAARECCATLGLTHSVYGPRQIKSGKHVWEVCIRGRENLERFAELVPLRSQRKAAAVREALASYKQLPRPPREWLEQKYVLEGLSLQQVAEAWGARNSASAFEWMRFYGIPTRSIADANRNRYAKARH